MRYEEFDSQRAVIRWFEWQHPQLKDLLVHIPNGQNVGVKAGVRLKALGLRAGYPDLLLNVPKQAPWGEFIPALYIEMKSKRGRLTKQQDAIIAQLENQGYLIEVCRSPEEAMGILTKYLSYQAVPSPAL